MIEAGPADPLLLDQTDAGAGLGSTNGGDIASRPAADDGNIVCLHLASSPVAGQARDNAPIISEKTAPLAKNSTVRISSPA